MTYQILVRGTVQGVGFRPFVYNLAKKYNIAGYILNNTSGVEIKAQGQKNNLTGFQKELKDNAPRQSRISSIETNNISDHTGDFTNFQIKTSHSNLKRRTQISPDLNVCRDCLQELFDSDDRRYLYPFINCTNCGPRFTIIEDIPYDRPMTTMKEFKMCDSCESEYQTPSNRRFHAQPDSCFDCGPRLLLFDNNGNRLGSSDNAAKTEQLFRRIARLFGQGRILGIKSNGGFHLACNALDEEAVMELRKRKYRYDKALAVMFPELGQIEKYCHISSAERELVQKFTRPIVLLKKKDSQYIAPSVAPRNSYLGVMLPYNPIQYLLFHYFPHPLIMTSGNVCGEPILYQNDQAMSRLSRIADYLCIHDRKILMQCDDSVYRIFRGKEYPIRRSRGYTPGSIKLELELDQHILACGAERKNTFAVARERDVWLSQHIGDLENLAVLDSYETSIEHFLKIFDVEPRTIAYDQHPDYLSTKYAHNYDDPGINHVAVQHHHAHAVSCMAENGLDEPVIAIVMDGTGAGPDGTIWGGEVLLAEHASFERKAYLENVKMPGGKSAIYNPWEMAVSYLYSNFGEDLKNLAIPCLDRAGELGLVIQMLKSDVNTPLTSSCGRLFDGVAALAGVRSEINYEGQAAIELENKIAETGNDSYDMYLEPGADDNLIIKHDLLIKQVVGDVLEGASQSQIALKFHNGLANVLLYTALNLRQSANLNKVVLSGGVFMNNYLLDRLVGLLQEKNFDVYWHSEVPANDGGISLGQVVIANAKSRE